MRSLHCAQRAFARAVRRLYLAEPLETRRLLATNLGELIGRVYRPTDTVDDNSVHSYDFTLGAPARVQVQITNVPGGSAGFFNLVDLANPDTEIFRALLNDDASATLPPGSYQITVADTSSGFSYTFAAAEDSAGVSLNAQGAIRDGTGLDFGALSEAPNSRSNFDFVGYLDTSDNSARDLTDTYFFDVPVSGIVSIRGDGFTNDPADGFASTVTAAAVFRDANSDGLFAISEEITNSYDGVDQSSVALQEGDSINLSSTLAPGRYAVQIFTVPVANQTTGGTNYNLRIDYDVPDPQGSTIGTAQPVGTIDQFARTFNGYLSSEDKVDFFKFNTLTGGPFVLEPSFTNGADDELFAMDVIRDINNDGAVTSNEVLASTIVADQDFSLPIDIAGTYFVDVRRISGEGAYTLSLRNRSLDVAGNTLTQAKNLFDFVAHRSFDDFVSANDTMDIFRFNLPHACTFTAKLGATTAGTNANLRLIRDVNGNFNIDAGDEITFVGPSGGVLGLAKTISRSLPAANNYYILVERSTGTPGYHLDLNNDAAGGSPATARVLTAPSPEFEFIGPGDDRDFFRVDISSTQRIGALLEGLIEPVVLTIGQDNNGDGLLQAGEFDATRTINNPSGALFLNERAGRYFIAVDVLSKNSVGTSYKITFGTAPTDSAGNSLATAKTVTSTATDFVGTGSATFMNDFDDFYKFTPPTNGPFNATFKLSNISGGNVNLDLIRDANHNGNVDADEVLRHNNNVGGATVTISEFIDQPGPLFIHVHRTSGSTDYTLNITNTSLDTAGNTPGAARNLGALTTTLLVNEFLGGIDPDDFYKFTMSAPGEVSASIAGALNSPFFSMDVTQDGNNNGLVDPGETLMTTAGNAVTNKFNGLFLSVGNFFLRVHSPGVDSSYQVQLKFTNQSPFSGVPFAISNTAQTIIEAENFDNGGEPEAYSDSDDINDNGAFRANEQVDIKTTSDATGTFRVTDTTPGEFLEYSAFVNQSGNYDLGFRVASPVTGGKFHLEVDGANVTGSVNVPNTGGFDTMQTVTVTGVHIDQGPHSMRLAFDVGVPATGLASFSGSYNFIAVTPSNGVGTFSVFPQQSSVAVGHTTKLAVTWKVPSGSWRQLKDIELRLRGDDGSLIIIDWNEAANTFALFNPASKKFGPAKTLGSNSTLSNNLVDVLLASSSVQAAGPTSPTVEVTFTLRFNHSASGHTFTIDAAATNDAGEKAAFALGGTVHVT